MTATRIYTRAALCLWAFVAQSAGLEPGYGTKLMFHSFEPPFDQINPNSGDRTLSDAWKTSGSTEVNRNFARVTPDRQSKSGGIWSKQQLKTNTLSATFKFRISGQGEKFFGDGIAIWFTHTRSHRTGSLYGFAEQFVGFGIVFDTFKNSEMLHVHKDVMLVYNTGKQTSDTMFATNRIQGCDGDFRFHNQRADFSVDSATRARILIEDGKRATVHMDWHNTNEWNECASIDLSEARREPRAASDLFTSPRAILRRALDTTAL